ncbi:gp55 [Rhodococcus phage ReqiPine5]|uniref:Gp55 n=1 Tax=Rhodococcus phage ReqiPine5 TaxID=691963 RepID=D4P830_9CAUD|nr:gp55 [Rhodococcus phage ReqiPine5]ADD81160.1 gp55 [Rhodococcus phage ReqiPine5]
MTVTTSQAPTSPSLHVPRSIADQFADLLYRRQETAARIDLLGKESAKYRDYLARNDRTSSETALNPPNDKRTIVYAAERTYSEYQVHAFTSKAGIDLRRTNPELFAEFFTADDTALSRLVVTRTGWSNKAAEGGIIGIAGSTPPGLLPIHTWIDRDNYRGSAYEWLSFLPSRAIGIRKERTKARAELDKIDTVLAGTVSDYWDQMVSAYHPLGVAWNAHVAKFGSRSGRPIGTIADRIEDQAHLRLSLDTSAGPINFGLGRGFLADQTKLTRKEFADYLVIHPEDAAQRVATRTFPAATRTELVVHHLEDAMGRLLRDDWGADDPAAFEGD